MKTLIYMAMSIDWYIADRNNKTPWGDSEWENYKEKVLEAKNIVIWYNTYLEMLKSDEFLKIWNPKVFVFTSKNIEDYWNFIFVNNYKNFELLLKKYNFKTILIAWWKTLNSYFIKNNLVDEMILDIEPFIFWNGVKLFDDILENKEVILLKQKIYWKNSIQLHFKFKK